MGYLQLLENIKKDSAISNKSYQDKIDIDMIPNISLADFKKRNMGVLVYSEFLQDEVWFCSNDDMAKKIKNDDNDATTYTADELLEMIKLNPSPEGLKSIHEAKKCFKNSKIM
ncbi:MAG: hypothetical protein GWM89_00060 [Candidatus Dadabacteria bacterium]|nr:hypothetical protein [Candidatus Dadabacteria bacterium]NIY20836.1 hypothetical protein [Candidatus Dadabacteria bacterium]